MQRHQDCRPAQGGNSTLIQCGRVSEDPGFAASSHKTFHSPSRGNFRNSNGRIRTSNRRSQMKKTLFAIAFTALMSSTSWAANIGVSMALFDDNFLTVLRNGMVEQGKAMEGVNVQVEDAQNDVAKQLDQIKNF